ncbi:MAG: hypothetical protein U0528_05120 [Anaerolineae bacterium]
MQEAKPISGLFAAASIRAPHEGKENGSTSAVPTPTPTPAAAAAAPTAPASAPTLAPTAASAMTAPITRLEYDALLVELAAVKRGVMILTGLVILLILLLLGRRK